MFKLIHRAACVGCQFFEPNPDQQRAADMVALDARLPTLATLQACQLFPFAVQLLNLPTKAARFLCRLRRILSQVVGDDIVRAVGGDRDPEALRLVVFGKAFDLNPLAVLKLRFRPRERIHAPVRLRALRIVHLPVVLERAVVDFVQRFDVKHQVFRGVPGVHQHGLKRQLLLIDHVLQHLPNMVKFSLAVAIGVIDTVVNEPELVGLRVDVDTGDDADTTNDAAGIAAILAAHQLDGVRVILIEHRVIEDDVALLGRRQLRADIVPDETRCDALAAQVTVDGIMAQPLAMVGEVRQRVIDLADEQVLAVVEARNFVAHGRDSTAFFKELATCKVSSA